MCQRRNFVWAFFDPSWFPKDFAPPGVLLGIQALGEVSHCTKFIFSFSNLTTNTLLTICLILGVNSSWTLSMTRRATQSLQCGLNSTASGVTTSLLRRGTGPTLVLGCISRHGSLGKRRRRHHCPGHLQLVQGHPRTPTAAGSAPTRP